MPIAIKPSSTLVLTWGYASFSVPLDCESVWLAQLGLIRMKMFVEPSDVYLHVDAVDFRKSINDLIVVVGAPL